MPEFKELGHGVERAGVAAQLLPLALQRAIVSPCIRRAKLCLTSASERSRTITKKGLVGSEYRIFDPQHRKVAILTSIFAPVDYLHAQNISVEADGVPHTSHRKRHRRNPLNPHLCLQEKCVVRPGLAANSSCVASRNQTWGAPWLSRFCSLARNNAPVTSLLWFRPKSGGAPSVLT
jgi:hypothetical protein